MQKGPGRVGRRDLESMGNPTLALSSGSRIGVRFTRVVQY